MKAQGMKEDELREAAVCSLCDRKVGASGLPLFWRLHLVRHGLDAQAISQQHGLAMMLGGNGALARIMGPNRTMTRVLTDITITVCEECAGNRETTVYELGLREEEDEEMAEYDDPDHPPGSRIVEVLSLDGWSRVPGGLRDVSIGDEVRMREPDGELVDDGLSFVVASAPFKVDGGGWGVEADGGSTGGAAVDEVQHG